MASDIARVSYDAGRHYGGVVMQQGRVFVEADWNEERDIESETLRLEMLDVVGAAGTPNNGYEITVPGSTSTAYDFNISEGTMYVGGNRVTLHPSCTYFTQPDWLNPQALPDRRPVREYIVLLLSEQEVSAVEDHALKDKALGGPDTAQRRRLMQKILRLPTSGSDCPSALAEQTKLWLAQGLTLDPDSLMLSPNATLQAGFGPAGTADLCEPAAEGGYLDADNQMIRIKVVDGNRLMWAYDDASTLYRVDIQSTTVLTLKSLPVDAYHTPRKDQAVEVLLSDSVLDKPLGDYIAAADGFVTTLNADYDPDLHQVTLTNALTDPLYTTAAGSPPVFLRIWNRIENFVSGTAVTLGNTGVQVTLSNGPFTPGQFWMFAVRPSTPQLVYPERYLNAPQAAEGPRQWICPLAVLGWSGSTGTRLADCRNQFEDLVDLTKRNSTGCCTVVVQPSDVNANNSLQNIVDKYQSAGEHVNICLMPGQYNLTEPLRLGKRNSNLTIEGCRGGVVIQAAKGSEDAFVDGLISMIEANGVTLHGLTFNLARTHFNANGKIAGFASSSFKGSGTAMFSNLFVSIGIRPIHCAGLHVRGCHFRYRAADADDIFGVGIFAGSSCIGMRVEENEFQNNEDLTVDIRPTQIIVGYLQLPTTIFASADKRGGRLHPASIDDAVFANNRFYGLTAAVFTAASIGEVICDGNHVRGCKSGFWFFSPRSLAFIERVASVQANEKVDVQLTDTLFFVKSVADEPLVHFGAVFGSGYPLPQDYKPIHVIESAAPTTAAAKSAPQETAASIVSKFLPSIAASNKINGTTVADNLTLNKEATRNEVIRGITAVNRNAWMNVKKDPALRYSLDFTRNNVVLIQDQDSHHNSSAALFVLDEANNTLSALTMTGNKTESRSGKLPCAFIGELDSAAVTGNLISNIGVDERKLSLVILASGKSDVAAVAVTGNVFRGRVYLPDRPSLPVPLQIWDVFNTILP